MISLRCHPRKALRFFSTKRIVSEIFSPPALGAFGGAGVIEGWTASGWEGVRTAFESNFAAKEEVGAQLCIFHKGKPVVDLSGKSDMAPADYDAGTLQCVFSSGKNMEAIAVAMLVSRGQLAYDATVSSVWPEYGSGGKDGVTIADVMRHEGGVPYLASPSAPFDAAQDAVLTPEDVRDVDSMERKIERTVREPRRLYHALTRGFVVNGILRRVDPAGRSLGRFIAEEISAPLGVEYFCGIPEAEQGAYKFADMTQRSLPYTLLVEVIPAMLGFGCPVLRASIEIVTDKTNPLVMRVPVSWTGDPPTPAFNNTPEGRAMEISSAGMYANARSMAKVNAAMAGAGEVGGVRLMSEDVALAFMSEFKSTLDVGMATTTSFSQGGVADMGELEGALIDKDDPQAYAGFTGWGGWGGSISVWCPERELAVAYAMSGMSTYLLGGPRTRSILNAVQNIVPVTEQKRESWVSSDGGL